MSKKLSNREMMVLSANEDEEHDLIKRDKVPPPMTLREEGVDEVERWVSGPWPHCDECIDRPCEKDMEGLPHRVFCEPDDGGDVICVKHSR